MKRFGYGALAAALVVAHLLCIPGPVSGPSTEEGNPQIVAVVVDSLAKPVAGVVVTAFRQPDVVDTLDTPSNAKEISSRITDQSGRCSFDSFPAGTYAIEANDFSSNRRAIRSQITIDGSPAGKRFKDTLVLEPAGGLRGIVSRSGLQSNQPLQNAAIMVIVQEIARSAITPSDGSYLFTGMPAGTYTIIYYATDGFISARRTVTVFPGATTMVDTVFMKPSRLLPPKGFSAVYDTTAGLVNLSWQRVDYEHLRWYEVLRFDLAGPHNATIRTTDTAAVDTVGAIPSGTVLTYVLRSVDQALNPSDNAGPIEVTVR